ncbi:DUF488 family protein (plasmid) [Nostoc sp. UHCC 0302]|uniref:DUF488 family protein, N3 subclade n=1 Tax=Nostoc sp. UHCC 0302 TaxID=3134896 RepID=UPI00311C8B8C
MLPCILTKNWLVKHLPLFAPTPELLKWWKSSAQDAEAELECERRFREVLQEQQQLIDFWVRRQQQTSADITLLCFEKSGDFCHRYIVGREVIGRSLPELWGGEVGKVVNYPKDTNTVLTLEIATELDKGSGLTDTQAPHKTQSKEYYKFDPKSNISHLNINNGAAAQAIVILREQPTNESLGTHNESTLTLVKSTTEHLTIPELLGGVKSYDELPPGWKNVEVIADVGIGTSVQVYNLVSRQWQPGIVKDYWELGGFLVVCCGRRVLYVFSGECVAVFVGDETTASNSTV